LLTYKLQNYMSVDGLARRKRIGTAQVVA